MYSIDRLLNKFGADLIYKLFTWLQELSISNQQNNIPV